jgi:hypothetical protein
LAHFVRTNSANAGLPAIVVGDLNTDPDELPFILMRDQLPFEDAAISFISPVCTINDGDPQDKEAPTVGDLEDGRSEFVILETLPNLNTFPSRFYHQSSKAARLDYILHHSGAIHNTSQQSLVSLRALGFEIDREFSHSDHCPVMANLCLEQEQKETAGTTEPQNEESKRSNIAECIDRCEHIARRLRYWQYFWDTVTVLFFLAFVALTITCAVTIPNDKLTPLLILVFFAVQPIFTCTMVITLFFGRIFYHAESVAFRAAIDRWTLFLGPTGS